MKVRKVGLSVFQSNISLQQREEMRLYAETGSAYIPKQLAAPTAKANAVAVCDKDPSGPSFCFVFFSCYAVTIMSDDHLKYFPKIDWQHVTDETEKQNIWEFFCFFFLILGLSSGLL